MSEVGQFLHRSSVLLKQYCMYTLAKWRPARNPLVQKAPDSVLISSRNLSSVLDQILNFGSYHFALIIELSKPRPNYKTPQKWHTVFTKKNLVTPWVTSIFWWPKTFPNIRLPLRWLRTLWVALTCAVLSMFDQAPFHSNKESDVSKSIIYFQVSIFCLVKQ